MCLIREFIEQDQPQVRALVAEVLQLYGLNTDEETDADLVDINKSYYGGVFKVLDNDGAVIGSY